MEPSDRRTVAAFPQDIFADYTEDFLLISALKFHCEEAGVTSRKAAQPIEAQPSAQVQVSINLPSRTFGRGDSCAAISVDARIGSPFDLCDKF